MWCVFPVAIGAIHLPIRGWRGTGAIDHVTVAGWAHVGDLRVELVCVIEKTPILLANRIFVAIERFFTLL